VSWSVLIDEEALAALLPAKYAPYARAAKEGLVVFLSGLPETIQESILAEQAALPATATLSERLGLMARSCPALHKLGQVLARDHRLAEELRSELRPLESLPPSVDLDSIKRDLTSELGPLEDRGITLNEPPLAEASVAVVVPFQQDAGSCLPRDGVFKVLKRGIQERLQLELELLGRVGSRLDELSADRAIPQLDYHDTFAQVRDKLLCEIQLEHEQKNLAEAAIIYANNADVQIPTLFEHCTPRVTAMERVFGEKVTEHRLDSQSKRRQLANTLAHALVMEPIFSPSAQAMFHSDPHAGNLLLTHDGRLAILDWSLVGHLGEAERTAMGQIVLGALTLDAARVEAVLSRLDTRQQLNHAALRNVIGEWLQKLFRGTLPGLNWLVGMLDDATQFARLRLHADMMLFRKSLLTIEGVINDLRADSFQLEDAFLCASLEAFRRDLPYRWLSLPTSRAFATRLSNLDLTTTALNMPIAMARFWQTEWLKFLQQQNSVRIPCGQR
jgi:ubiquinone biosynthesis protein